MGNHIKGLVAAPLTPFLPNGDINLTIIKSYAAFLVRNGVIGVFVNGTTGEGPSLTISERKLLAEEWVKVAPKELKIIVQVGHNSFPESIDLIHHAKKIGAYGVGSLPNLFFKPNSVSDLAKYIRAQCAAEPDLPYYYYHIPSFTGVDIQIHSLFEMLHDVSNLRGVKFSFEDLLDYSLCINQQDHRFDCMYGRDQQFLQALATGGQAAVGSTYNFISKLFNAILTNFEANNISTAQALQLKANKFIQAMLDAGNFLGLTKYIMKKQGIDCGPMRMPLSKIDQSAIDNFEAAIANLDIEPYWSV